MRKLIPIFVLALLVAFASPVSAKRVAYESHSQFEIQAMLHPHDEGSTAWAFDGDQGSGMGLQFNEGYETECFDPAEIVNVNIQVDEAELVDFVVSPTKGKTKYVEGHAEGVITSGNMHVDFCGDEPVDEDLSGQTMSIWMDGTDGALAKARNSNSFHIPGETNNVDRTSATMRLATGNVVIGDLECGNEANVWNWCDVEGANASVHWTSHQNDR